ncbi:MAG TPA: low specificity L-threonine aldolase [Gammaproteobacteria bacterium]|nr:low specificity L-threonine aldolase [Gammaproteobacteria bacterium]
MTFGSDNETGIAPEILDAMVAANIGTTQPYGEDALTRALTEKISNVFDTEVSAFLVTTGTAANALALSCLTPPYGGIYCHQLAHIMHAECAAPEFYAAGARLLPLPGSEGKLQETTIREVLDNRHESVHSVQTTAISLTQASEMGTLYQIEEIRTIAALAHAAGLSVHMDGTRFANALVTLGCSPAEMSWRCGVDVLCLGASKNGAMAAEAVIFFNPEQAASFAWRRKRGGHLYSKMRFVAAQFTAYLAQDRWLDYARHANAMARELAQSLLTLPDIELAFAVEANEVFADMPTSLFKAAVAGGFPVHATSLANNRKRVRLVCAFNTTHQDISELIQVLQGQLFG